MESTCMTFGRRGNSNQATSVGAFEVAFGVAYEGREEP